MSNTNKNDILDLCIRKLNLNTDVKRKANENLRLIQLKITTMDVTKLIVSKLNEISRIIICLEIACLQLGVSYDKNTALQLSGLKRNAYNNMYGLFRKLLGLGSILTIQDICLRTNCMSIEDQCELLYKKYKKQNIYKDFDHPQYVCMTVYIMCRLNKIKVKKTQFMEWSHLKISQWNLLESEFSKFIQDNIINEKKNGGNEVENKDKVNTEEESTFQTQSPQKKENTELDGVESYENWKARMLKFAREQ